ncbi:MAG: hypothetical protein HY789_06630 [Deltaproteobacteria bacterium]|nr:hypothetical protein [Deltaproteobacteria bacterium]
MAPGKGNFIWRVAGNGKSSLVVICFALFNLLPGMAANGASGWGGVTGGDGLPTEADCRVCHDDLLRFPVLEKSNVDKHHLLVGSLIVEPTAPPDAVLADTYECLTCHPLVWDADIPGYTVSLFRDCLVCHPVATVSGPPRMTGTNRHHELGYSCSVCHENRR